MNKWWGDNIAFVVGMFASTVAIVLCALTAIRYSPATKWADVLKAEDCHEVQILIVSDGEVEVQAQHYEMYKCTSGHTYLRY